MNEYSDFIASKLISRPSSGLDPGPTHESLYDFQKAIVDWAVKRGRSAVFADCGLGKTRIQIEWARQMGERILIVAPLCVAEQTIQEAASIGVKINFADSPQGSEGMWITNYEKLGKFVGAEYDAIVLDESSILKSIDGKTRTMLLSEFTDIPYRLCCTATPAPNDIAELANHAQFIGVMSRVEMLATFFVHDSDGWRLKGHAQESFWKWMVTWSLYVRLPSDLGFPNDGFILPDLSFDDLVVESDYVPDGMLFPVTLSGVQDRNKVRRETIQPRAEALAERIQSTPGEWVVWCGLNDEGRILSDLLGDDAVLIEGSDAESARVERHAAWKGGKSRVLISKPSIFGWGMNWQHCHQVAFLGLGDSYEQFYQAVRRCWRFGQTEPVDVTIVISNAERDVLSNIKRKEADAQSLSSGIVGHMRDLEMVEIGGSVRDQSPYVAVEPIRLPEFFNTKRGPIMANVIEQESGRDWTMYCGDSTEVLRGLPDKSVGLSVFSPPFASLYTYSNSDRDLGNSDSYDQFFEHFGYIIEDLLRVTRPCRRACVHVQQVSTTKTTHGVIGWRDFRADTVRHFQERGWIYDGEVVIDKDPQAQAIRTKSKALMFVQKNKDSAWSRPAMADYILLFRAPGENDDPIKTDVTNEEWIKWARPIWYGIKETETLNVEEGRSDKDERHICPLQLGTIRRCVRLWSNPGDVVLSPFAGIGSEGFESVKLGRKFVGIELKPEYYRVALKNLIHAESFGFDLFGGVSAS